MGVGVGGSSARRLRFEAWPWPSKGCNAVKWLMPAHHQSRRSCIAITIVRLRKDKAALGVAKPCA